MLTKTPDANIVTDDSSVKEWLQIRIAKTTGQELDEIHIKRKESYDAIIRRLLQFWKEHEDIVTPWLEALEEKE